MIKRIAISLAVLTAAVIANILGQRFSAERFPHSWTDSGTIERIADGFMFGNLAFIAAVLCCVLLYGLIRWIIDGELPPPPGLP